MKQLEADVVVIAAGTAGLAAVVAAAEGGAKVIAFERAATTGGTGNMAAGVFAVESRLQREKQIALTREEAFKIHMDYTHWRVDARLVKAYIDKSASTIDWLEEMGVEFTEPRAFFQGSNFTWHVVKPSADRRPGYTTQGSMMKILTDRAQELGVRFFLRTRAKKVIKENGWITGVMAEDESGEEIKANARAVIIATGGFGDNPDMIKKYTGFDLGHDLFWIQARGLVGDGIRMAWEVGAAEDGMNMELIYMVPDLETLQELKQSFRQPGLVVNISGERFINEEIMGNTTFTGNAIARQKNRCAFAIFDEATKKHYQEKGVDFLHGPMYPDNFDDELRQALDQGHKHVFVADSLEELAGKTGINLDGLLKSIDEYNKACEAGRDEMFNKKARYLRPVKQPKFYAGRLYPNAYGSLGGIKINYKMEVLNKDHDVIPGLYAAGTDANTIYGDSYIFVLPGNTMGFALNSGRIAGENAAQYIKSIGK